MIRSVSHDRARSRRASLTTPLVAATLACACAATAAVVALPARRAASGAAAFLERGRSALDGTDYRAAVPAFREAATRARAAGDRAAEAEALRGLAVGLWGEGDYAGASRAAGRLYDLAVASGDANLQAVALNGLGLNAYSEGDYRRALAHYERALATLRAAPSPKLEGLLEANVGLVYRYEGRYEDARRAFTRSLALRREAHDDAGVAQTLNHLGMLARATGRFEDALAHYRDSLAIRRRTHDRQGEAQTLNNMANVFLDLDERDKALDLYRASLAIAERIGYTVQIGIAEMNVGAVLEDLGRREEARARFDAALAVYRRLSRRDQIAFVLRRIGGIDADLGDTDAARRTLDAALREAEAIGQPDAQALTLDRMALLEASSGRRREARAALDRAESLVKGGDMPDVEYRVLADRADVLEAEGARDAAIRDLRASAAIVTDMRARLTTDLGKIGFLDRRDRVFERLADLLVRSGRADEALEAAERGRARALADLLGAREVARRPASRAALERLREAVASRDGEDGVAQAFDALRSEDRDLASAISVDSPRIAEIRAIAARLPAAIVEYLAGDKRTLAFVVDPAGTVRAAVVPVAREDLRRLAAAPCTRPNLERLSALLLDPIERWLPKDPDATVVLVPSGPLAFVPFAALVGPSGRPALERHTFVYAPAISVYRTTEETARRAVSGPALVLADPTPPAGSGLARLPAAREEASAVARALGPARTRVLLGAAATETAAKTLMPGASIIHVAAHGLVTPGHPLASSIALAATDADDGYLRVDEVFGLDLRARLVVLSGCATGAGTVTGDGVVGFARAFLYAGTPAVVVSRWDVPDRPTADLMGDFYRSLARGLGPARALRRAELAERARDPRPEVWAGFLVVGEP